MSGKESEGLRWLEIAQGKLDVVANKRAEMDNALATLDNTEDAGQRTPSCEWYDDGEKWETECGEAFCFHDGGPVENGMKFCPYCGKPLGVKRNTEDAEPCDVCEGSGMLPPDFPDQVGSIATPCPKCKDKS